MGWTHPDALTVAATLQPSKRDQEALGELLFAPLRGAEIMLMWIAIVAEQGLREESSDTRKRCKL